MDNVNQASNPDANLAASAAPVVGTPIGTEHIEQILDVGVQLKNDYKSIMPTDSLLSKVSKFMPTLLKAAAAVEAFAKAGPEIKDITGDEIKAIATKYAPQFGVSGKVAVYVEEGANILNSGFKILKAK